MALTNELEITSKFLRDKPERIKLGLAIESAMNKLREDTLQTLQPAHVAVRDKLRNLGYTWKVDDTISNYNPRYWLRLRKEKIWSNDKWVGIRVESWDTATLRVGVKGWPDDDIPESAIQEVFDKHIGSGSWTADSQNDRRFHEIFYDLDVARVLIEGNAEAVARTVVDLILDLVRSFEGGFTVSGS